MSSELVHIEDNEHSGETVNCTVQFLDGDSKTFDINVKDDGQVLYNAVCDHFKVTEKVYFGLKYTVRLRPKKKMSNMFECVGQNNKPKDVTEHKFWLQLNKQMSYQIKKGDWKFEFALKFYPPVPTKLEESCTRSLVVLQIQRDMLDGRLPCSFEMLALLESYYVQAELGDYVRENRSKYEHDNIFLAKHQPELLDKIVELHKQHKGQTHNEAQMAFLDNAKKFALYGVDLHKARDLHNVPIDIGVSCNGITVYKDHSHILRFVWPKILHLVYKQKYFYIKIRPEKKENPTWQKWKLDHFKLAKNLWRICTDQHNYFRLKQSERKRENNILPRCLGYKISGSSSSLKDEEKKVEECLQEQMEEKKDRRNQPRTSYSCPHQFISVLTVQLKTKQTGFIHVPHHRLFVLVKGKPIHYMLYNARFNTITSNRETTLFQRDLKKVCTGTITSVTSLNVNIQWTFW